MNSSRPLIGQPFFPTILTPAPPPIALCVCEGAGFFIHFLLLIKSPLVALTASTAKINKKKKIIAYQGHLRMGAILRYLYNICPGTKIDR